MLNFIVPHWPAPKNVFAATTTRHAGYSQTPFNTFNTANHVGDVVEAVSKNRRLLRETFSLSREPIWLNQVHGVKVVHIHQKITSPITADASFTEQAQVACVVQTADCLPILLCDRAGTVVAAIHAGWKGLSMGIIKETVKSINLPTKDLLVWLGPAIGPQAFEVGLDVFNAFTQKDNNTKAGFKAKSDGLWLADLFFLAKQQLNNLGVTNIYSSEYCTYNDKEKFFSYRREGTTGRMASLIFLVY